MASGKRDRIIKALRRLRLYRKKWSGVAPLRLAFRICEKKLKHDLRAHWRGMYVVWDNEDYQYIPRELDQHGLDALTEPPSSEAVIGKFCKWGTTAIDVGANIGQWAVPMARAVGKQGQLFAFEPIPAMYAALNKTFQVNGWAHARAFDVALSNRSGTAEFFVNLRNDHWDDSGLSSLEHSVEAAAPIKVKTITLDEFAASRSVEVISFIKIDVEGHEYAVLEGAKQTLSAHRPVLVIETGHENEEGRERIHRFFSELDYELLGILYTDSIDPASWKDYRIGRDPFGQWQYVNLLLIPRNTKAGSMSQGTVRSEIINGDRRDYQ
jgi:FkbM family methyltransferase